MLQTRTVVLSALLWMLAGQYAWSDDLTDATQALCDSVKSCALEQVAQDDLAPETQDMMGPMLDNMCANMRDQVKSVPVGHALYQPAVGCIRSMVSLSCDQMRDPHREQTPECAEYEQLARQAGITEP